MDKKTATLYDSLGILPTATDDEIRRAAWESSRSAPLFSPFSGFVLPAAGGRKIALQYHPDKNRTADPQTFQGVARSYGILSDSKKKAVYDRRTFFDPEVRDMVCCLVMGFAVLVLLTLLFLLAVVLRIDGIITWTWSVVFLPVW
ncbi:MAG: hypothetical protein BJ554DRAFT_7108, partial [Olpidium bornovanus]